MLMRSTGLLMKIVLLLLAVALAAPGCGRREGPVTVEPGEQQPSVPTFVPPKKRVEPTEMKGPARTSGVTIGVLVPFSGARQADGEAFLEGLKIALGEKAQGTTLTAGSVLTADSADGTEDVVLRAGAIVSNPKVLALTGLMTAKNVEALDDMARHNELCLLSPCSEPARLSALGSTVLRLTVDDVQEGSVAATFAIRTLLAKTAAVMVDGDLPASDRRTGGFVKQFKALGGAAPVLMAYTKSTEDFRRSVRMISSEKPDVIYLPGTGGVAADILKVLKEEGVLARVIGCTEWDVAGEFGTEAAPAAGIYALARFAPDRTGPATRGFLEAYRKDHPAETPNACVALGYDAGLAIIEAMRTGAATRAEVLSAVRKLQNVRGATGPLAGAEGTLVTRVPVVRLSGKGFVFEKMMPVE
jgi:branched-chain amino acid transport system substrate-binding protein